MAIVPDQKDWTWVLQRACPECRFEAAALPREEVGRLVRTTAREWVVLLGDRTDRLRLRPRPDCWSVLEYACHVRDVYRIYEGRLRLMLAEDDPAYPNWDQDRTAVDDEYNEQEPAQVSAQLAAAAEALADRFDSVSGAMWERTGRRSDGAHFTVDSFARYMIHDPIHHLHDVAAGRGPAE